MGIGHILDVEDPLARADVIVALSGDTGARTDTAIDLWKRQYAPLILFAQAFGPDDLTFINYPARDTQWDPNTWFLHEPARTLTAVELAKLSVEVASTAFH